MVSSAAGTARTLSLRILLIGGSSADPTTAVVVGQAQPFSSVGSADATVGRAFSFIGPPGMQKVPTVDHEGALLLLFRPIIGPICHNSAISFTTIVTFQGVSSEWRPAGCGYRGVVTYASTAAGDR